jgi:tol-pal system beta propeller repeat protein TolB
VLLAVVVSTLVAASPQASGRPSAQIAFSRTLEASDQPQRGIWLMNGDGSAQHTITGLSVTDDHDPAWSPDRRRIAFVSGDGLDHPARIYLMNADGSHRVRLSHGSADGSPAWSPDGRRIVFGGIGRLGFDLYVVNADGRGLRQLTRDKEWDDDPAWSPDGRQIAFDKGRGPHGHGPNLDVYVMNADGSGQRRLTRNPGDDRAPVWSPDGRRIAYAKGRGSVFAGFVFRIHIMNDDGSGERQLTNKPANDPAWSPDGKKIAFSRKDARGSHIHVMNADGGGETKLTRGERYDEAPAW